MSTYSTSASAASPGRPRLTPWPRARFVAAALACCTVMSGCGTEAAPVKTQSTAEPDCMPSRTMFDAVVKAHVASHCGTCHGETPNFGAPNTLTGSYESLVAGAVGTRFVDRIALRMANKTMPPTGGEPVPHQVQDTLVEWASCGAAHPDHSVGLVVDQPVFTAPKTADAGLAHFDLTADNFAVAEDELDLYECFTFSAPVTEDRFVRRIEVLIDQSKVLHHVVLLKDPKKDFALGRKKCKGMPSDSQYLYAWAPGAGAVAFPEGGMRVKPGEHYIVQIHYNNGAAVKNVKDNSGVRIFHGPVAGTEYGMVAAGPLVFSIPPHSTTTATGHCLVKETTTVLAGMPHMHENGVAFEQVIVRKDGTRETLVSLTGWSFEMQPFYRLTTVLNPGDRVETSCTWRNDTADAVNMGTGTSDEMCFDFMFVTPPPKNPYCNDFVLDASADAGYLPGKCAGADAAVAPALSKTKLLFTGAPDNTGGDWGTARWQLKSATLALPAIAKTYMNPETSTIIGRGQAWTEKGRLTIDASVRILLELQQNNGVDTVDKLSMSGKVIAGDKVGEGTWTPDCGGTVAQPIGWSVHGDELTIRLGKSFAQFVVPGLYTFQRVGSN